VRILILGLDSAGKTTILYRLHCGEVITTIPSALYKTSPAGPTHHSSLITRHTHTHTAIGFNVEVVQNKNVKFQVWDLGGQDSIRPYWRCYYANTDAVIFVVDSAARARMETARDELRAMLEEEELHDSCLLVFANKQDLPNAMTDAEVSDALGLPALRGRQWAIFKSSAVKGTGLLEGLDWLTNAIIAK